MRDRAPWSQVLLLRQERRLWAFESDLGGYVGGPPPYVGGYALGGYRVPRIALEDFFLGVGFDMGIHAPDAGDGAAGGVEGTGFAEFDQEAEKIEALGGGKDIHEARGHER